MLLGKLKATRGQQRKKRREENEEQVDASADQTVITAITGNSFSTVKSASESFIADHDFVKNNECQTRSHHQSKKNGDILALPHNSTSQPEFVFLMKFGSLVIDYYSQLVTKIIEIGNLILGIHVMFKEHVILL